MNRYIKCSFQHQIQIIIEWIIIMGLFYFQFVPITNISIKFLLLLVFNQHISKFFYIVPIVHFSLFVQQDDTVVL